MDPKQALINLNIAQAQAKLTQDERLACLQSLKVLEELVSEKENEPQGQKE